MSKSDSVRPGRSTVTPSKNVEEPQNARTGGDSIQIESLHRKLHFFYKHRVLPKISGVRGTTRPLLESRNLLLKDVEKVEQAQPVKDLEWDNLVILDGCRLDTYREVVNSEADSRITAGSASWEFLEENFSEGDWGDTVYVSANPYTEPDLLKENTGRNPDDVFYEVFNLLYDNRYYSEEHGTVPPENVLEVAELAAKLYPEKRLILHFMQPHFPFIDSDLDTCRITGDSRDEEHVWEKAEKGVFDRDEVYEAYKENLEILQPHLNRLSEFLGGRTVVTADHGNLIGEGGIYGHPQNRSEEPLRKVPWDVISE